MLVVTAEGVATPFRRVCWRLSSALHGFQMGFYCCVKSRINTLEGQDCQHAPVGDSFASWQPSSFNHGISELMLWRETAASWRISHGEGKRKPPGAPETPPPATEQRIVPSTVSGRDGSTSALLLSRRVTCTRSLSFQDRERFFLSPSKVTLLPDVDKGSGAPQDVPAGRLRLEEAALCLARALAPQRPGSPGLPSPSCPWAASQAVLPPESLHGPRWLPVSCRGRPGSPPTRHSAYLELPLCSASRW